MSPGHKKILIDKTVSMKDGKARCYICIHKYSEMQRTFVECNRFVFYCSKDKSTKKPILCYDKNPDGGCKDFEEVDFYDPMG